MTECSLVTNHEAGEDSRSREKCQSLTVRARSWGWDQMEAQQQLPIAIATEQHLDKKCCSAHSSCANQQGLLLLFFVKKMPQNYQRKKKRP